MPVAKAFDKSTNREFDILSSHADRPVVKYGISVKTADQSGAGTDSNISIMLHGTRGVTDYIKLNNKISGDAFERGQLDRAPLCSVLDLGKITSISLRHDGSYSGAEWRMDYSQINDGKT